MIKTVTQLEAPKGVVQISQTEKLQDDVREMVPVDIDSTIDLGTCSDMSRQLLVKQQSKTSSMYTTIYCLNIKVWYKKINNNNNNSGGKEKCFS